MFSSSIKAEDLRKFTANSSWLIGENILRMAVGLFVGIYIARQLGPERFGALSYAESFTGLFVALVVLGLPRVLTRELVKQPERRGELLGSAFALISSGGILTIILLIAITAALDVTRLEQLMIIIIGAGMIFQAANVIDYHYQSLVQSRHVVEARLFQLCISTAFKLGLLWANADLVWFAVAYAADSALLAIGLFVNYQRTQRRSDAIQTCWSVRIKTMRTLLGYSWPLIFSSIAITVYMKIDQVMIRSMLDVGAVGQYAAAVRISEVWYFIPVAITTSLFPTIISDRENNTQDYLDKMQWLFRLLFWLAIAIAIPVSLLSDWLVLILFGESYAAAGPIVAIHVWAAVFVFINNALQQWYVAEGLERLSLVRTVTGLLLNIVLNLILIPRYGLIGAAWATLASRAAVALFLNLIFSRTRPMFWMILRAITIGYPANRS